jgi:hypothetical protein
MKNLIFCQTTVTSKEDEGENPGSRYWHRTEPELLNIYWRPERAVFSKFREYNRARTQASVLLNERKRFFLINFNRLEKMSYN